MKNHGLTLLLVVVAGCGSAGDSPPAASMTRGPREQNEAERQLNPRFPVIEGTCNIAENWSVTLPNKFNRRTKSGDLIVWRPGMTLYVVVWNNDHDESGTQRLAWIRDGVSTDAFDVREMEEGGLLRFAYRLTEHRDGKALHALYGYAIGKNGHVQTATYCEHEADLELARQIWRSWREMDTP